MMTLITYQRLMHTLCLSLPVCMSIGVALQLGGDSTCQFDIGDMAFDTAFEHDYASHHEVRRCKLRQGLVCSR